MEDHWTKKRGFVNPATSEISRSPVSGMSFSDSQRRILGGLPYLKTYHTTGDGNEIIMKSFGNVTSIDIKEPIISRAATVKSEYIMIGDDGYYFYIHVYDSATLQETAKINIGSIEDFWGYGSYWLGGPPCNPVWDHKNKYFVVAAWGYNEDTPDHPGQPGSIREGRILCFNENGNLLSNRELFLFDDTDPDNPGTTIVRLGNAITVTNGIVQDKIWASVYHTAYSGDSKESRVLYSITNGSASVGLSYYHGVAMDSSGNAVRVYGDDYYNADDWWALYSGVSVEKGDIYKAIMGPEGGSLEQQIIKLYDANDELINDLGNYPVYGEGGYGYFGKLTYFVGTNLLCQDIRGLDNSTWPPGGTTCRLISISGVEMGEIDGAPVVLYGISTDTTQHLGVGERVTAY